MNTALQRIQYAFETNDTGLDLSGLHLTSLPSEIFKLSNLTVLVLAHNNLTILPVEITQLINLQYLCLSQ
ncbi:MAG: hypothetical protein EBV68_12085, partial [Betaproteobacteria bacterium]|nr:hypothetical protein [Betaproteobacteria bacterium]